MFTLFAVISGVLTTLTVAQNGQLADFYGSYSAAMLIHAVGMITVLCWRFFQRKSLPPKKPAPPWMFMGGVIGVATTVFINSAFGGVSVTAIMALGLLGQLMTSIVVDQLGFLGTQKNRFSSKRLLGLTAVLGGAAAMLFPLGETSWVAVLLSLVSGVTIVFARMINGQLAERQGAMRSTVMNYITGLTGTTLLMLLVGRGEPFFTDFRFSPNVFIYLGGAVGVVLTMLLNLTVPKLPAFAFTLLQFVGQIFTGLVLDVLLQGSFSWQSALGGVLVAAGLCLDNAVTKGAQAKGR
ncbi:MAG: DMT family transporter [Clostridia bacterium]